MPFKLCFTVNSHQFTKLRDYRKIILHINKTQQNTVVCKYIISSQNEKQNFNSFSSGWNVAILSGVELNTNIFQTIHRMETEIASFERGELPLSNDTNFNFITSLVDVKMCINLHRLWYKQMLQLCINVFTGSNFKYVNNFMNVAERNSFDLQVPEVACM
jgi:hypothetical protein